MYIQTKDLTLEDGEHEVVLRASDKVFSGYDIEVETNMIQKKDGVYIVREQETWDSLPIYEIKNCTVVRLDFTQYEYFTGIKRRKTVSEKIRKQYNPPSENKIMRKIVHILITVSPYVISIFIYIFYQLKVIRQPLYGVIKFSIQNIYIPYGTNPFFYSF